MKKIMKILSVVMMIGVVSYVVPDTICNVSAVTSVYGDVNNDGIVSSADIVCMNKLLNGNLGVTEAELLLLTSTVIKQLSQNDTKLLTNVS